MIETRSFKASELVCKHCGKEGVSLSALNKLQKLRDLWEKPMILTSAYRCPEHPEEVKKAKGGTHTKGIAFDVKTTPAEQVQLMSLALSLGFKGFGMGKTFTHLDLREQDHVSAWHY